VMVPYADFNLLKFPDKEQAMEKIRDLTCLSDIFPTGYHGAVTAGVGPGTTVYVAGGAFALACIAGVMYLFQEQQLNTRQLSSIFFRLPPIGALSVANSRLLWLGFTLFTVGITTGFLIGQRVDWMQATWSIAVWCVYGGILIARVRHAVGASGLQPC
jgi:ABC-type uncharacterized transport system permease subunit